jgi:hypothetical protein
MKNRNITTPFLIVLLVFNCLGSLPKVQAVVPAPDGGYPGLNTAEGEAALFYLTTGISNTAIGFAALANDTTGSNNTATGAQALFSNTSGSDNTANGSGALFSNTTGDYNTATGFDALGNNTIGVNNTANGINALFFNTGGDFNTAAGGRALSNNTTGNDNTATGFAALDSNTTGSDNTAIGVAALQNNNGDQNIALGHEAGLNLTTGDNNIDIANLGVAGEAGTIRIGMQGTQTRTFVAGINGAAVMGVAVKVNAAGQLGTSPSSRRFKTEIKPMDKASQAIHALKPVTFHYQKELDPESTPQFGLVAEDVEKVNPDLVVRDKEGKPYTVRYDQVNAMLLNEFLKEHRKVQELQATIAKQQKHFQMTANHQQRQIEALTIGLQKVSDQIDMSKSAVNVARNN